MTEFEISAGAVLGLMPRSGAAKLLGDEIVDGATPGDGVRGECYLLVEDPDRCFARALDAGGRSVSAPAERDWGHRAGYFLDPDGHLIAVARPIAKAESADPDATESEPPAAARIGWFERFHEAVGPVAAGLVLDGLDLITFGPLGLYAGPVIGFLAGWYLAGFYRLAPWPRIGLALVAAIYLTLPMTAFIPAATLISIFARFARKEDPS